MQSRRDKYFNIISCWWLLVAALPRDGRRVSTCTSAKYSHKLFNINKVHRLLKKATIELD